MPQLTVWLVRHGESTANAGLPSLTHADVLLTDRGREQAAHVARAVDRRPDLLVTSPFLRARATAEPIAQRWPGVPQEVWPIEEFSYLSAERCRGSTVEMRRPWVRDYWERADPHAVDGPGAESFAQFMQRLQAFGDRLLRQSGFVVAVGHGQFFRAFLWGESHGFEATPARMADYRAAEVARPMGNGEVIAWHPVGSRGT